MARPRTRPTREETGERLLDGAMETFAERGFHGASLDAICDRAGLTRGAFHNRFASKDELFLALYDRMADRLTQAVDEMIEAVPADASDPLACLFEAYGAASPLGRSWYLLNAEVTLYAIRQPAVAGEFALHRRRLREQISASLTRLLERSGWTLVVDADLLARTLIALADGGLSQSLIEPETLKPGALLQVLGRRISRQHETT